MESPTPKDFDKLIELIDDRVMDDWAKQVFAGDAERTIAVSEELTAVELQFLTNALAMAQNQATQRGEVEEMVYYRRLFWRFLEHDEDLKQEWEQRIEEAHNAPNQLEEMIGAAMGGMGMDDLDGPGGFGAGQF